jgi:uncharacterized membrane protein YraQ (UPF0718 family)
MEILEREAIYLWYYFTVQFEQIFFYYALGIVIGSLVSVFGKQKINRVMEGMQGKNMGVFGLVPASVIGLISPLCMYGTIPIAASFSEKGMRDDWLAAFMMSSVLLNPQLIMYSAALGSTALFIRILLCFLCGIFAGLCVRFFYTRKEKSFFNFTGFYAPDGSGDTPDPAQPHPAVRLLKNIGRNIKVTAPYFFIGIALAAAFQRYVPDEFMVSLFGNDKAFGVLMAATIGVPLYACGGGTIPLLQQWLASGMSMGAAAAFMITGPATKITNLGALKIVLGARSFALYWGFIMAFSALAGIVINLLV